MLSLVVGVVLAAPAWATEQEASSTSAPDLRSVAGGVLRWSLSPLVQAKSIPSPEDDDDVGGFFDQYEFTPNKGSDVPLEIGIREGALDFFSETETPIFQLRFASPSSNLGLTGSAGEDPFFDQRLAALARVDGLDVDLRYGRTRTEQLRLFPNTAGARLVFNDFSSPKDRFYRDRTGVSGEVRLRPHELAALGSTAEWLAPELSLRGGYEERDGEAQRRFLRNPSNTWLGASQDLERDVADVGGGLLVAPGGLFTLALDFDYERFRFDSDPLTEADFGFAPPAGERPVSFTPSSDRYTGTARFNSRVGDRVQLEGGFQISQLEQAGDRTPEQRRADLDDVEVRTTSANAAIGWRLSRSLSLRGFFKFDQRDNDISRSTSLFNPDDQIVPFVEDWDRILAGAELEMRLARDTRVALGLRYEDVSRDLDFARGAIRIFPENALIDEDTEIATIYARTSLSPLRGLSLRAELGYREAFETGYVVDLDDNLYGELRATQVVPWKRPLVLSAYVKGSTGENDDFDMVSARGATPQGPEVGRSYDRWNVGGGLTASHSPVEQVSLFASLFYWRDFQDASLDLSSFQRYFQNQGLLFARDGRNRFRNEQLNLILGSHFRVDERTDGRISYTFTHVETEYRDASSRALDLIADNQEIDAGVHAVDLELRHQLRAGLRLFAGYRFQLYDDDAPRVESIASAVRPFDRSTHQHTITFGVTLTSELISP
jgi:hypothetical protein